MDGLFGSYYGDLHQYVILSLGILYGITESLRDADTITVAEVYSRESNISQNASFSCSSLALWGAWTENILMVRSALTMVIFISMSSYLSASFMASRNLSEMPIPSPQVRLPLYEGLYYNNTPECILPNISLSGVDRKTYGWFKPALTMVIFISMSSYLSASFMASRNLSEMPIPTPL
ncbi:hypothetical protein ACOME3_000176 [Neoechinorhynchus agilis]